MEGMVNVEWHGQDYLHLKWHVLYSVLATPVLRDSCNANLANDKIVLMKCSFSQELFIAGA